ncbi:unnamed protein product [Boreogadus saida]
MWNQPSGDEPLGQVSARVETTPGNASISVSQQQAPKKFAPVVAPKPKFNPYKGDSDAAGTSVRGELSLLNPGQRIRLRTQS